MIRITPYQERDPQPPYEAICDPLELGALPIGTVILMNVWEYMRVETGWAHVDGRVLTTDQFWHYLTYWQEEGLPVHILHVGIK
jgi:hypothetical protein